MNKRKMFCCLTAALIGCSLAGTACAAEKQADPYSDWTITDEVTVQEDTVSQEGAVWKTLYGTVTADELSFGELRYWVYLPEKPERGRTYPLVLYLHDSTVSYNQGPYIPWTQTLNRRDLKVADELRKELGDCIIFAPQAPSTKSGTVAGSGWTNTNGGEFKNLTEETSGPTYYLKAVGKLLAGYVNRGIRYEKTRYTVDEDRLYLIGDSMGAIGAYAMLEDFPETFAAVMVRAGIGNPGGVDAWKDTPIRIFHGTVDTNVRYECSTRMIEALKAAGAKDAERISVEYGSHDIRDVVYQTKDEAGHNVYLGWLAQQSREHPEARNDSLLRFWWIPAVLAAAFLTVLGLVFRKKHPKERNMEKTGKKRLLTIFLAVLSLLCLTACGGQTGPLKPGKNASVLNGKKVIFIGCSYFYFGGTVRKTEYVITDQEKRANDEGYFYQLCRANGAEVSVMDWCYGGHSLQDMFGGSCNANNTDKGHDHLADLVDRRYDYVIIQEIKEPEGWTAEQYADTVKNVMEIFRQANPDVKFYYVIHNGVYVSNYPKAWRDSVPLIRDAGAVLVDWGSLVWDVIKGNVQVPGAEQEYRKNSFIVSRNSADGYHPNLLSGYLSALMTYCAITGENAVGQPYSFCTDGSIEDYYFDAETFADVYYSWDNPNTEADERATNLVDIFRSAADMKGLQELADQYLADPFHLNQEKQ
jgi:dienelactone hydrolase